MAGIAEIPRSERYLNRHRLKGLFEGKLAKTKPNAQSPGGASLWV
jgi:hypothetical protein